MVPARSTPEAAPFGLYAPPGRGGPETISRVVLWHNVSHDQRGVIRVTLPRGTPKLSWHFDNRMGGYFTNPLQKLLLAYRWVRDLA